jgi:hypothetical protein
MNQSHKFPKSNPERPKSLSNYAEACLRALSDSGLAAKISIGGALGLQCYLEYRPTHDVDAWWEESIDSEEQRQVVQIIQRTLESFGKVKVRSWGDVISIELVEEKRITFSFQIARRFVRFEPPSQLSWTAVPVDSLTDLVAAKMTALVERGAPRDFRDIFMVCQAGLVSAEYCWTLWRRRQQMSGSDTNKDRASLAIETHLMRISQFRPLQRIENQEQRLQADKLRKWFSGEFLHVLKTIE